MEKHLLKEDFNLVKGNFTGKDGKTYKVLMIDPATSESTFPYKDEIKKFGARWLNAAKTWGWFINDNESDEEVYTTKIKPCLEYLLSVENGGSKARIDQLTAMIDALKGEIASIPASAIGGGRAMTKEEISNKLEAFKQDLVNSIDADELKEKLAALLRFQQGLGHKYSFANTILIYIQDPEATLVKAKTRWEGYNHQVVDFSHPVYLFRSDTKPLTPQQKTVVMAKYLREVGVNNYKELNAGQKEELDVRLKSGQFLGFKIYAAYDVRFTKPMEGKESLVPKKPDLPWYDNTRETTEKSIKLFDTLLSIVLSCGIQVTYADDLGGALGVSMGGKIELLKNLDKNIQAFKTFVHEFSHELLHQKYVQMSKIEGENNEWAEFFIGREGGRNAIEQQAELSVWVVCRFFGYDEPTSINYAAMWGMDKNNACKVFDTVAKVASFIYMKIDEKLNGN